jgi:predicted transposase/invertase (TIGR01784 family)
MSRQEIAKMLEVEDLKQTRFYQEAFAEGKDEGKDEGKLEAVSRMVESGVDLETIAYWLDLPIEKVRKQANQQGN